MASYFKIAQNNQDANLRKRDMLPEMAKRLEQLKVNKKYKCYACEFFEYILWDLEDLGFIDIITSKLKFYDEQNHERIYYVKFRVIKQLPQYREFIQLRKEYRKNFNLLQDYELKAKIVSKRCVKLCLMPRKEDNV